MKSYEKWWEKRLKDAETFVHFSKGLQDHKVPIRLTFRDYIKDSGYKTILDCGAGLCRDGELLKDVDIKYNGIDITPLLVKMGKKNGFNIKVGSIENIPYKRKFDVVYCRAVLEHLKYYEKAISEMNRLAKKEVLICFFRTPLSDVDACVIKKNITGTIYQAEYDNNEIEKFTRNLQDYYFQNRYNKEKMESFIRSLPKIKELKWEYVTDQSFLHIYKDES